MKRRRQARSGRIDQRRPKSASMEEIIATSEYIVFALADGQFAVVNAKELREALAALADGEEVDDDALPSLELFVDNDSANIRARDLSIGRA